MHDLNKNLQDHNEQQQQIDLQANLRRAQNKAIRDLSNTRLVERCLFGQEPTSVSMPQPSNVAPRFDPENTDYEEIVLPSRGSWKRKDHATETDDQTSD
ncbi:unnamed protein product [Prunus armeniaca]|uniref:Uncharacterized protein n=1 Tax=Prunus armeniaca TaxID=36596 RepID=A0A6J5UU25_PRUAR|nr:unnamed protein product [Prunus armeniaca]CAB4309632.1 unnamed protein product [Prunus armeniaca]